MLFTTCAANRRAITAPRRTAPHRAAPHRAAPRGVDESHALPIITAAAAAERSLYITSGSYDEERPR